MYGKKFAGIDKTTMTWDESFVIAMGKTAGVYRELGFYSSISSSISESGSADPADRSAGDPCFHRDRDPVHHDPVF